jgi:hypothetical protein
MGEEGRCQQHQVTSSWCRPAELARQPHHIECCAEWAAQCISNACISASVSTRIAFHNEENGQPVRQKVP